MRTDKVKAMDQDAHAREKTLLRYGVAIEEGDFDAISAALAAAERDPILERQLTEMNAVYQAEYETETQSEDAATVRGLLTRHLSAALTMDLADPPPLTVGDVAAHLQTDPALASRLDAETLATSQRVRNEPTSLPTDLSQRNVRRFFEDLGVQTSERFRKVFRDAAILLAMGREQSMVRMAATRRQREQAGSKPDTEEGNQA